MPIQPLSLDCAASELFKDGMYVFKKSGAGKKDAAGMIEMYSRYLKRPEVDLVADGNQLRPAVE